MYSIGVRIYDYGITIERYLGIIIILIEIVFICLSIKKYQKHLIYIFPITALFILISLTIPYVNCVSIARYSQLKRLTSIYKENTIYDKLSDKDKETVYNIYSYLIYEIDSRDYLPKYIDTESIENNNYRYDIPYKEVEYYNDKKEIDVTEYTLIKELNIYEYPSYNKTSDNLKLKEFNIYDNEELNLIIKNNFINYLNNVINEEKVTNTIIYLDDKHDYYIKNLNIKYSKDKESIHSLILDGYILTK